MQKAEVHTDEQSIVQEAERVWASDASIQAEFASQAAYVAWRKAEASGRGRILNGAQVAREQPRHPGKVDAEAITAEAENEWSCNAAIRTEFGWNKAAYLAFRKAEAAGRARIHGSSQRHQEAAAGHTAPALTGGNQSTLQERQALVRQENVGRQFAGLQPLPLPQD